jgi:negative regulator of sigma-B (phosphoserine phosphatase)
MMMTRLRVAIEKRAAGNGQYCGDACLCMRRDGRIWLCTVDGLGHGHDAQVAAEAAIEFVKGHAERNLKALLTDCDAAIRHTRGGVMGVAVIDEESATVSYAGVGNIRCLLLGKSSIRLVSYPGIVGAGFRTVREETHPIEEGALVIMYTDGLPEAFDLSGYPGDHGEDLEGMARSIMNDWYRGRDDAAVMVFRYEGPRS